MTDETKGAQAPTPGPLSGDDVKLKPCPFCGNDVASQGFSYGAAPGDVPRGYHVFCLECSETDALDGPRRDTLEEAIEAWNTRPSLAPTAPVEASGSEREIALDWRKVETTALEEWRAEFGDYAAIVTLGHNNVWSYRVNNSGHLGFASADEAKQQALKALTKRLTARLAAARETVALYDALRPQPSGETRADALRAAGWSIAVHNDYRLNGEAHTFWLWTHPDGRWVKGEGRTDEDALSQCAALQQEG